jgi:hypothetical protein
MMQFLEIKPSLLPLKFGAFRILILEAPNTHLKIAYSISNRPSGLK